MKKFTFPCRRNVSRHRRTTSRTIFVLLLAGLMIGVVAIVDVLAVEHVEFIQGGHRHAVTGEILIEALDGGLMIQGEDGQIWTLQPEEIEDRKSDDEPYLPLNEAQLVKQMLQELPAGFAVHRTANYLVFFNTSRAYAQWCGSLFERLHRAFYNFWRRRDIPLHAASTPLIAIVFNDEAQYREFGRADLGDGPSAVIGYYSLKTNRVMTYDLTGLEATRQRGERARTSVVVNQILAQPAAAPSVATLIHEAVHQLAFNCGLQTRYADNPLWLSEGLAVYFEVPDLSNSKGWRGIGAVHPTRLKRFRQTQPNRPRQWLKSLIATDDRFRDPQQAVTAYAEGWALCHFLINRRETAFVEYLKEIGQQPLLDFGSPEQRSEMFVKHFGDCAELERDFYNYIASL